MEEVEKILVLSNEIEARLLQAILLERNIPHIMKTYHDSAYDGIFQMQKGWGHVEAPERYKEEIKAIHADLPLTHPLGEDDPEVPDRSDKE